MAEAITIAATARDRAGKGAAREARRQGLVPGVIYGDKQSPVMINLNAKELERQLRRPGFFNHLFEVKVGKDTHRVLARELQQDPVTDRALHVDFLRVSKNSRIEVAVPVHFINETKSPGLKRGGVLNIVRHEVEVFCSPEAIPEELVIDLTGWDVGDSIHISAVTLPDGVVPTITDRDFTVATIAAPSALKSEENAAGDEAEEEEED
ncbi:50S ribosomal protein L25/general stress protein Ctc [Oceanibaculum indicum]|uniref:Large ribosomal subunit protein bL25 n=1 Tax=Oceanibaculum indicum P24 TaxID=1207063 RepID=K2J0Q7_9PROT|nr:50S ribosomal protein L25/general stress protein Ctc [Oceanibaculum indicum]EKE68628.1 50S ribosomal protein L25/general stress protein Ctc [Oceanibaculum indicum P24]